jgi:RNA-directed DNA polymerase
VIIVRYADDIVWGSSTATTRTLPARTAGTLGEVRAGAAPGKDPPDRVRPLRGRTTERRGEGKPETFDFLGFTHICGKTRKGGSSSAYRSAKRLRAKLQEVKEATQRRMHEPVP